LDATTNYSHGFPFFCISIALEKNNEIILGVVYDPIREELFTAQRQKGAFLNNKRIAVSRIRNLSRGLVATGFPYRVKEDRTNLKHFENFIVSSQAVRRAGSAALDLCYVACGRFDGFWEIDLHPWDTAAASLIVEEAKGMVSDFRGKQYSIYSNNILASNGKIHYQMIKVLNRRTGASFPRKR
jgi:myo-inositol-1(or 4)-monophosphatase